MLRDMLSWKNVLAPIQRTLGWRLNLAHARVRVRLGV